MKQAFPIALLIYLKRYSLGIEIERKFLVDSRRWNNIRPENGKSIIQGYLSKSADLTVRIRIKGNAAFITVKGATENISRTEFEYEIPVAEAQEMLDRFCPKKIKKIRYKIDFRGFTWEVDEFERPNKGLILAEIELLNENATFPLPDWLLEEVSGQPEYYNSNMI